MTHDELTKRLRAADHDTSEGWPAMALAANRLDRYRELLDRAIPFLIEDTPWQDEAQLRADIERAIK